MTGNTHTHRVMTCRDLDAQSTKRPFDLPTNIIRQLVSRIHPQQLPVIARESTQIFQNIHWYKKKTQLSNSANVTTDLWHQIREWDQNDRFKFVKSIHLMHVQWVGVCNCKILHPDTWRKKNLSKTHSSLTVGRVLRSLRRVPCLWHAEVPYKNNCYVHSCTNMRWGWMLHTSQITWLEHTSSVR